MQSGDRLAGFELLEEIGRGGMGVVFKARDLSLDRVVALKILLPGLSSEAEYVRRFKREAQIIAALRHPSIVGILSSGEADGRYFFAMEYVAGRDLNRVLKEQGTLSVERALSMATQIASALDEANARGIIHRDVKPSNIMVDDAGNALITDFGIARLMESQDDLTQTGTFLGTPEYAAPELLKGVGVDVRSDIYSLGAVLYKSLSGEQPISGDSALAVMLKASTEGSTPLAEVDPTLPAPVCDLVERMMAVAPEGRPQTPGDLLAEIREVERRLAGKAFAPLDETVRVAPSRPGARNVGRRMRPIGAALGALVAVVLVVWSVESRMRRGRAGEAAGQEQSVIASSSRPTALEKEVPAVSSPGPPPSSEGRPVAARQASALPRVPIESPPALPEEPVLLVMTFGDEPMVQAVRAHLESSLLSSGLDVISVAEIPVLRERLEFGAGSRAWSRYEVRQFVPSDKAQIVVLAQIQKTGSSPLRYMGRVAELTLARFSVQTIDTASGHSIHADSAGSIQFTALNMDQNLRSAIAPVVDGLQARIQEYWKQKRLATSSDRG